MILEKIRDRKKQAHKFGDTLECFFEPPRPERKEEFLQGMNYPQISFGEFFRLQAGYIHKGTWAEAGVLFLLAAILGNLLLSRGFSGGMVAGFSSVLPFGVVLLAEEVSKSRRFGMEELEMSARYHLGWILSARLVILSGTMTFLTASGGLLVFCTSAFPFLPCMLYLTVPVFFNGIASLWISRRMTRLGIRNVSFGISIIQAGISVSGVEGLSWIYEERFLVLWGTAFCVLAAGILTQIRAYGKKWRYYIYGTECFPCD